MSAVMQWKGRLGVPYQGSKNQIAKEIISILPRGKRFVDLFAGGCAMTHAAMISGKYDTFLANDLHGFGLRLFMDAIAGKCNGRWREWVSREEFLEKRDKDPLVSLCWSFGNNMRQYICSKEKEAELNILHKSLCVSSLRGKIDRDTQFKIQNITRVIKLEKFVSLSYHCKNMTSYFLDYRKYKHSQGDVVYCDPPYEKKAGYAGIDFDTNSFWEWVSSRNYPVFVSEYNAPKGFTPIWTHGKCQLMHAKGASGKAIERVYVADRYADRYQTDLFLGLKETN